jgi:hypothetical protein
VGFSVSSPSYHLHRPDGKSFIAAVSHPWVCRFGELVKTRFAARNARGDRSRKRSSAATNANPQSLASIIGSWVNSQRHALLLTWVIFTFHLLGLLLLYEPMNGLFDQNPLIDQDWGLHFFHLNSLEAFWQQDRSFSGYNPFFMAGYRSNTIQDLSIKFFEYASIGLASLALSSIQWFKLTAFLSTSGVPWLMFFSARNLFSSADQKNVIAVSAALLGTAYWWNSLPREMFFYGMIGFPVAAYLSILGVSLFYRMATDGRAVTPAHFGWLGFALAILSLHVQSVVMFAPPLIALLIIQPKLIRRNLLLWTLGTLALALFVNFFWLWPALMHRGDDLSKMIVDQLPIFASTEPLTFLIDYLGTKGYWTFRPGFIEKGFRLGLLFLAVLGLRSLFRHEKRAMGMMLACALIVLFLVTYFGALSPSIKAWQPLRFKVPLDLFLTLIAAYAIGQWTEERTPTTLRYVPWLATVAICAFFVNLLQTEGTAKLRLRSQLRPELQSIVEWIQRDTPSEARVLFEESGDETGFVYDGIYLSSFIPGLTGRSLIGGPINLYNDRHHFAEFHSGKLLKRDIGVFSDQELRNYFKLYNIGAVVAFYPPSVERLESVPGLVTLDRRIGPVHLLKVNQNLSWFVQGEGKVKADLNRLKITEIKGQEVILKYHWIDGLRSEPTVKIAAVKLADDPIPFIKIVAPPTALAIGAEP